MVLTPLPDIAMHVAEAKGIGNAQFIDRGGFSTVVAFRTVGVGGGGSIISDLASQGFAEVEGGFRPGSTGILPFGFAGKTVRAFSMLG